MSVTTLEILIVLLLITFNGFLAMAEMSIVAARRPRLRQQADDGDEGAAVALELAAAPTVFLSTVQIGITLVGILAGAFGGATLAEELATRLREVDGLAPYSEAIGVGLVVIAITYFTLVFGELAPKRVALQHAERIASRVARPVQRAAQLAGPLVSLLSASTEAVLRLVRIGGSPEPEISEDEIRMMIGQAAEMGIVEPVEEEIVGQVFRLGDRRVSALITPRIEIAWLDVGDSAEAIRGKISAGNRSRYPVADGELDSVVGIVRAKDLLSQCLSGEPLDIASVMSPALFVPESMPALDVVERFKATHTKIAMVIDEFGGLEGMVTIDDLMAAVVGEIQGVDDAPQAVRRADGSWLLDGRLTADEFRDLFGLEHDPGEDQARYQTVGGLVMTKLDRVPSTGDRFTWRHLELEVVDMDGRRVDKVLVTNRDISPIPPQGA